MTDISTLDAKDVIRDEALPEYSKGMEFFYLQLVHLNTTIFIVEHILNFPFELFSEPDKTIFFRVVIRNSFDTGLLMINRLVTDQGDDLYTLIQFKNRVREIVKPEFVKLFDERLRQCRFDSRTRSMFERAKMLRNERIGHTKQDVVLGLSEGAQLNFSELKSLRDALNLLLDALSFNVDHMMLPVPYDSRVQHPIGSNHKPDIEEFLDSIALNSALLNLPEKNPAKWSYWREELTEADISKLNSVNHRLGR